jgi:cbb3-type cytochrome c oxidase subunit III
MNRIASMITGVLSVATALAFVGPAGARTRHHGSQQSSHQSSTAGRQLFARNCARCHGASGQGKNGPKLAGKSLGEDAIEEKVTNGGGKMPSFKKRLTPAQIKAVAAYVQSLGSRS